MGYGGMAYVFLFCYRDGVLIPAPQTACLIYYLCSIYSVTFAPVDSADNCYDQHHGYRLSVLSVLIVMHRAHQVQTYDIHTVTDAYQHSESVSQAVASVALSHLYLAI